MRTSIAVTGSTGYVGRSVRRILAQERIGAVCIARKGFKRRASETAIVSESWTSPAALSKLRGCSAMIHLAGIGRHEGAMGYHRNVDLARRAVEACRRARIRRMVFVSGLGADSRSTGYFTSKLEAERRIAESGIPHTILRASYIVGRGDALTAKIRRLARARRPTVPGTGRYIIQPAYVDDACRAIVALARAPDAASKTLDLVGPERISYRRFVSMAAGAQAVRTFPAEDAVREAAQSARAGYDIDELAILLGSFGGRYDPLERGSGVRFRRISAAPGYGRRARP